MSESGGVGVFDSGVGGLTVLKHIREELPNVNLLYCADSAHAPYGEKSPAEIVERSKVLTEFLLSKGAQMIVVACNTATAAAIHVLREKYKVPFVGMEPAIKPATKATRNGVIGILATTGTLKSAKFSALLGEHGKNVRVVMQPCPGLVELIESGQTDSAEVTTLVGKYLSALLEKGADTIVLGCTHYPFLRPLIEKIAGKDVSIIDTGKAVAKQVSKTYEKNVKIKSSSGRELFWTSSDPIHVERVVQRLWQTRVKVSQIP